MSQQPIRIGVIGLGRTGWKNHTLTLGNLPGYELTAVADPLEERRQEAFDLFKCRGYATAEALIADPDLDVVVIATPTHTHVPLARLALERGKHVIVEKPMAKRASEVDELIALSDKVGKVLTCYQPRRLNPTFLALKEWVETGRLGRIVLLRAGTYSFQRRADWQMLLKFDGGELGNHGAHVLDCVLQLLADGPLDVWADLKHTVGAGDAEDFVKVLLRDRNGVTADIEITRCCALPQPDWVVMGTYGTISGSGGELNVRWHDPAQLGALEVDEGPAKDRKYGTGEVIEWREETLRPKQEGSAVVTFYEKFAGTLHHGDPLFVTPQSIRRQIDVMERAREMTGF